MRKSLLFHVLLLSSFCGCGTHKTGPAPAEDSTVTTLRLISSDSRFFPTQEQLDSLTLMKDALEEAYEDSISRITGIAPESPYWYDPSWDICYSAARDTLYYYPRDRKAPHFSIPSSVRVIDERAFQCNKFLTEITIPAGVNEIGVGAFLWSQALTSVTIKGPITSLPWRAFEGCPKLKRVDLPASLSSLEGMTFCNCIRLESITVRAQEPPSLSEALVDGEEDPMWDFYGVDKERCILLVPKGCAAKYREAEGWNLFKNIREL